MNKLMKKIVTVALALTMVMSTVLSVSATGLQQDDPETGTLTKILEVPKGVPTPDKTFNFVFTKSGIVNGSGVLDSADAVKATMPGLSNVSTTFGTSDTSTTETVAGYWDVTKTITDIVPTSTTWPHAGEYVYMVSELQDSPADPALRYSLASYQMTVYVENTAPSDPNGNLIVKNIGFKQFINDAGTTADIPAKADPIFRNRYKELVKLDISKMVTGQYADATLGFVFTPTFERALDKDEVISIGTIIGADGTPTSRIVTVTFAANGTTGVADPTTFTLAHGETIKFEGVNSSDTEKFGKGTLPIGTTWTVMETGSAGYTASAIVNNNSATEEGPFPTSPGTAGANLTVNTDGTNALIAGLSINKAAFTNEYRTVSPTGILLNNLPFILLIVVALGGFVGYIASKRRKATN